MAGVSAVYKHLSRGESISTKENHADKSTDVVPIGSRVAVYGQAKISSYHRNCCWRRERQCNR
jgi:hypothetical protein